MVWLYSDQPQKLTVSLWILQRMGSPQSPPMPCEGVGGRELLRRPRTRHDSHTIVASIRSRSRSTIYLSGTAVRGTHGWGRRPRIDDDRWHAGHVRRPISNHDKSAPPHRGRQGLAMPSWRSTRAFVLCFAPAAAVRCEIGDVVIVGAGASGIAMAKAFTQRGCRSITIYEKAHTVGGHWAWAPNYVGVGVQNKRDAYRFSDKAMAGDGPRANAADVVAYLQDYARERGFSQQIRLGMEVEEVVEAEAAGGRRELMVRDVKTG